MVGPDLPYLVVNVFPLDIRALMFPIQSRGVIDFARFIGQQFRRPYLFLVGEQGAIGFFYLTSETSEKI